MSITHIVLFQFKSSTDKATIDSPYIKASSGGRDNSPEGIQHGITHAFVVEFILRIRNLFAALME
ncbi:hypothetical protein UA08_04955 [Talaromyces atroroseus]|uniref:Uncharacterized protein n=1 Tax=Talaromyces atroroseus TaxID=1441469 RepID=A0A225AGI7_TALAT|nr:hypothetical protein UA08_04955 [Talaromyces atroroseus]OKL59800.1 hypothetical protein UA08_04955 [Talaromyces atroroseus]